MEMRNQIVPIVSDVLEIDAQKLTDDEKLQLYGLDSINAIQIIVAIEEKFGFVFPEDTLRINSVESIRKIMKCIDKYAKRVVEGVVD